MSDIIRCAQYMGGLSRTSAFLLAESQLRPHFREVGFFIV